MTVIKEQAETYQELESALADGKTVQVCTINQGGKAVDWNDVNEVNRAFAPNRYRICEA